MSPSRNHASSKDSNVQNLHVQVTQIVKVLQVRLLEFFHNLFVSIVGILQILSTPIKRRTEVLGPLVPNV